MKRTTEYKIPISRAQVDGSAGRYKQGWEIGEDEEDSLQWLMDRLSYYIHRRMLEGKSFKVVEAYCYHTPCYGGGYKRVKLVDINTGEKRRLWWDGYNRWRIA